jgi:uncharacterized delta-60 repeat protein
MNLREVASKVATPGEPVVNGPGMNGPTAILDLRIPTDIPISPSHSKGASMSSPARRRRNRPLPAIEPLECRALLANAGAIVPSFGTGLVVNIPFEPSPRDGLTQAISKADALGPNGTILLAGAYVYTGGGNSGLPTAYFAVERLKANGSLDTTFGQGGEATFPINTVVDSGNIAAVNVSALVVQSDGSILEAGSFPGPSGETSAVIRITSSGALDTTYGSQGIVTLPTSIGGGLTLHTIGAATLTAGGQLLLAGSATGTGAVQGEIYATRLNANGAIDTTFGVSGFATVPVTVNGIVNDLATGVSIQPGGRIIVAGEAVRAVVTGTGGTVNQHDAVVVGLTAAGAADNTFGTSSGVVLLPPSLANSASSGDRTLDGLAVSTSGTILLGGSVSPASQTSSSTVGDLIRLTASGALDSTFGQGGTVLISDQSVGGVAIEPDGKILVPGSVTNPITLPTNVPSLPALGRFLSNGTPDATFGLVATPGLASYPIGITGLSDTGGGFTNALINSSGQIVLAGSSTEFLSGFSFTTTPVFEVALVSATATVTPAASEPPVDLAGTGTTDLSVYLTSPAVFVSLPETGGAAGLINPFGSPGDGATIPAVADYQGAGHAQIAAYLTVSGYYAILPTGNSPGLFKQFGVAGKGNTIPVPGDYEGTGKDDVAVYLTKLSDFAIIPSNGSAPRLVQFGAAGIGQSIPAPADYYGTGQDDIAVYIEQAGAFLILSPDGKSVMTVPFGMPGLGKSIPVPGDYDNSGHTELAVYIPSLGAFFYRPYDGGPDMEVPFGTPNVGELPVVGDYDGVGHDEFAVYDPTRAFIAYRPADGKPDVIMGFGTPNGSIPVATPAGALPELGGGSNSGGSGSVRGLAISAGSAPASASAVAVTPGKTSAVPTGPAWSPARVARSLVNQGSPDPLEYIS